MDAAVNRGRKEGRGAGRVGGDAVMRVPRDSERARVTLRGRETDGWARDVSERRRALGWAGPCARERESLAWWAGLVCSPAEFF